jgi:hypothetical protein
MGWKVMAGCGRYEVLRAVGEDGTKDFLNVVEINVRYKELI